MPLEPPGTVRSARQDAWALLALAVLHLILFQGILFGDETLYYDDVSRYQLPLRSLVAEALRNGELPLWNPYLWLGTPLAANPASGVFYPLNWALLPLSDVAALNLQVVFHLYLGGLFTYLLARERAGSGVAAFAAAVAFSLGGIALSSTASPIYLCSLAWLPAALFAFRRALAGRTLLYGVLAALAVALMALAGDLQLPIMTALVLSVLSIFEVALAERGNRIRVLGRAAAALLLALGVGLALAAVQVLPTLEFAGLSERAAGIGAAERHTFSFHPARLITFIVPYAFGVPAPDNSYWGWALGAGPRFWFASIYGGALLLVFAVCAVRRGDAWTIGLVVAAVLLVCFGVGPYLPLYEAAARTVPGLDQLRYPEKFLAPLAVLLPVLGAEGLVRLGRGEAQRRAFVLLGLFVAAGAAAFLLRGTFAEAFARRFPVAFLVEEAARRISRDGRNLLVFAATGAVLLGLAWRGWITRRRLVIGLAAFALTDVAVAGARLVWTEPASWLRDPPSLVGSLETSGRAPARVFRRPALDMVMLHRNASEWRRVVDYLRESMQPNQNVLWRVAALVGYGGGAPSGAREVLAMFQGDDALALARVLSARWRLEPGERVLGLPEIVVSEIEQALPRARLCGASPSEGTMARGRELIAGGHDFARAAVVEAGEALRGGERLAPEEARTLTAALPPGGEGEASIARYTREQVDVEVEAARPSLLVLAEAYYPGWRATVDGVETPIFRADFLARAVAVPAGRHVVRFSFEAPALWTGARVSLTAAGGLGLLGIFFAVRRRVRRG